MFLITFIPFHLQAQDQKFIVNQEVSEGKKETQNFNDSLSAVNYMHKQINDLVQQGFLLADFDISHESDYLFTIQRNAQYKWARLNKGNLPTEYTGNFGFESKFQTNAPFSLNQITKLFKYIISRAENEGFPFAYIALDSISVKDNQVDAVINFESGPLITFDSIKVEGFSGVNKKWLSEYLGIRTGSPFQEKAFLDIVNRVERTEFLALSSPPAISFQNDQATVILSLEYKKANAIDAVIGFAPNASSNNKLLINGQADLLLNNLFKRGHKLSFGWRSIKPETQELDFLYAVPNIFNSPISVVAFADMFKQDTSFLNQNLTMGLSFRRDRLMLGAFTKFFKSAAYGIESDLSIGDIKVNSVGLSLDFYDSRVGFTRKLRVSTSIGDRKVQIHNQTTNGIQNEVFINGFLKKELSDAYFSLEPIFSGVFNDNLLMNDLLRIGGIKSIRGFPENFFYVKYYTMLRNEYHWVVDNGSSFFVLGDISYMDHLSSNYAYGVGTGFDLKINNGIFEIIYAIGGYENVTPSFDRSVVHFGYKAIF